MTTDATTVTGVEIIAVNFIKPVTESCVHGEDGGCPSPDVFSNRSKGGVHLPLHFKVVIVLKLALLCPCFGSLS